MFEFTTARDSFLQRIGVARDSMDTLVKLASSDRQVDPSVDVSIRDISAIADAFTAMLSDTAATVTRAHTSAKEIHARISAKRADTPRPKRVKRLRQKMHCMIPFNGL